MDKVVDDFVDKWDVPLEWVEGAAKAIAETGKKVTEEALLEELA